MPNQVTANEVTGGIRRSAAGPDRPVGAHVSFGSST